MAHAVHPELTDMEDGYFADKDEAIVALRRADEYEGPLHIAEENAKGETWLYYGEEIRYYKDDPAQGEINYLGCVYRTAKGWVNRMVA